MKDFKQNIEMKLSENISIETENQWLTIEDTIISVSVDINYDEAKALYDYLGMIL